MSHYPEVYIWLSFIVGGLASLFFHAAMALWSYRSYGAHAQESTKDSQ